MTSWWVGSATEDITPPGMGYWLAGYWPRRRAELHHAPLQARVVFLQVGENRLALVSLDLLGMKNSVAQAIARAVSQATGLPPENLWLCCTHTHSGPDLLGLFGGPPPRYEAQLAGAVTRAVRAAMKASQPARLSFGQSELQGLALNRRQPEAPPHDNTLAVLGAFTPKGQRLVTLVNTGIHPVVLGKVSPWVSPDFPGELRNAVEEEVGGMALFFNRAHGDVNPRFADIGLTGHSHDTHALRRFGEQLAAQALAVSLERPLSPHLSSGSAAARPRVLRPAMGLLALMGFGEMDSAGRLVCDFRHAFLGDLAAVALPGEVFGRLSVQVQQALPQTGLLFGLQGGYSGYLLSEADFRTGGYEEKLYIGHDMPRAILAWARSVVAQASSPV